jgi:hypothetical protein
VKLCLLPADDISAVLEIAGILPADWFRSHDLLEFIIMGKSGVFDGVGEGDGGKCRRF